MTLTEIKEAINQGKKVYWSNLLYEVVKGKEDYLIKCSNSSVIGLTWADGATLNGKEEEFFTQ